MSGKPWKKGAPPRPWSERLKREKKRENIFRKIMIFVAGFTILSAVGMFILVTNMEDDPVEGASNQPVRKALRSPTAVPKIDSSSGAKAEPNNIAATTNPPAVVDPAPSGHPKPALDPVKPRPVTIPPNFAEGLIRNDLSALDADSGDNRRALIDDYARDLAGDESGVKSLNAVLGELQGEDPARALKRLETVEFGARIENALAALVFSALERTDETRQAFARADFTVQPAAFDYEYARFQLKAGKLVDAYPRLETAARKSPETLLYQRALVRVAFELKKWNEVIDHVDEGIRPSATPAAEISLLAAYAETRLGRAAKATTRCEKIVQTHPESADAKLLLALLLRLDR